VNPLNSIYKELVYGGHLLSLGTASIAATAALILGRMPTLDLLVMAYLFSNGAYTLNRASEVEQDNVSHPARTDYLRSRAKLLPFIAGLYFLVGYSLAFFRNLYFFGALLLPLVLSLLYSFGSKRFTKVVGSGRLKEKLLIKNLAISFGWSLIPLLVGLYYLQLGLPLLLLSPFIFLRLMVNTIFFDVRDVQADAMYGTGTIPAVYGISTAGNVMWILDGASLAYIVLVTIAGMVPSYAITLAVFPLYSSLYRLVSRVSDQNLIRDLVADGEYLLWGPVVFLGKI
jgi:4-hydroxybenzoate polyprenyltransferase